MSLVTPRTQAEIVASSIARVAEMRRQFRELRSARARDEATEAMNVAYVAIGRELLDLVVDGTEDDLAYVHRAYRDRARALEGDVLPAPRSGG